MAIVRTVANELDSARFDPLLVRTVAKNAATSLESVVTKAESLACHFRLSVDAGADGRYHIDCYRPCRGFATRTFGNPAAGSERPSRELFVPLLDKGGETHGRAFRCYFCNNSTQHPRGSCMCPIW